MLHPLLREESLIIISERKLTDISTEQAMFLEAHWVLPFLTALTSPIQQELPLHSQLQASGENVGLPDGQMGNSEVGHLNIGAGRVVYQDLVKINKACRENSIMENPEIISAFSYARDNNKNIHFMGLTSDGGVHSSLDHLFKLCDISPT